jgi:hypothetical protein
MMLTPGRRRACPRPSCPAAPASPAGRPPPVRRRAPIRLTRGPPVPVDVAHPACDLVLHPAGRVPVAHLLVVALGAVAGDPVGGHAERLPQGGDLLLLLGVAPLPAFPVGASAPGIRCSDPGRPRRDRGRRCPCTPRRERPGRGWPTPAPHSLRPPMGQPDATKSCQNACWATAHRTPRGDHMSIGSPGHQAVIVEEARRPPAGRGASRMAIAALAHRSVPADCAVVGMHSPLRSLAGSRLSRTPARSSRRKRPQAGDGPGGPRRPYRGAALPRRRRAINRRAHHCDNSKYPSSARMSLGPSGPSAASRVTFSR